MNPAAASTAAIDGGDAVDAVVGHEAAIAAAPPPEAPPEIVTIDDDDDAVEEEEVVGVVSSKSLPDHDDAAAAVEDKQNTDEGTKNTTITATVRNKKNITATTMPPSKWPKSLPHPESNYILSVVCGNSRFHWALHETSSNDFMPCLFWK